jgi:hypothetical protein
MKPLTTLPGNVLHPADGVPQPVRAARVLPAAGHINSRRQGSSAAANPLKTFFFGRLDFLYCAAIGLSLLIFCFIGAIAAILGIGPLDRWCAKQLTDTDGQPEQTPK